MNDDLNGTEKAVSFSITDMGGVKAERYTRSPSGNG